MTMSLVTWWTQAVESWKCWKTSSLTLQVSRSPETSSGGCRQSGGSQSPSNHCRPASSSVLHGLHLRSHAIHLVRPRYDPPQHDHGHVHQRLSHPQKHRYFRQPMVFEPWPDQMGSTRGIQPAALPGRGRSAQQRLNHQRADLLCGEAQMHWRRSVQDTALPLHVLAAPSV